MIAAIRCLERRLREIDAERLKARFGSGANNDRLSAERDEIHAALRRLRPVARAMERRAA